MNHSEESLDAVLDGQVRLRQPLRGYRFAVDSLLLADFVECSVRDRILDIGTGVGVIPLVLWKTKSFAFCIGAELQVELARLAAKNVEENDAEEKIAVLLGDVRRISFRRPFDALVCNPPYRKLRAGRLNTHPGKAAARHEISLTLGELFEAAEGLCKAGGTFSLIHLPERAEDMARAAERRGFSLERERAVLSRAGGESVLILRAYRKGAPQIACTAPPPLILYEKDRAYSEEAQAIFRGRKEPA